MWRTAVSLSAAPASRQAYRGQTDWLAPLEVLKRAGAAGPLLGLLGLRYLGTAAAIGLTIFFAGALATHVRARVFHNIAFPGAFFALATADTVLAIIAQ